MSVKSLWVGPLFGFACVSLATVACSGDAFTAETGKLDQVGGTPSEASSGSSGSRSYNPKGVTPVAGGESADGGAPDDILPVVTGGTTTGGVAPIGGTVSTGGVAAAGSGGTGAGSGGTTAGSGGATAGGGGSGNAGSGGDSNPPIDPQCATPITETWSEPLSAAGLWHTAWGDPVVDQAQHRLVLSYDDVAERTQPYDGSYYVESDVTIVGGTAFTPYPYTFEVLLPTLRRDAAGTGIQLGATQYGPTSWTASGWGDLSGSIIAGTTKLRVGAYLQVTSKKFAVKVSYGGKQYRSTWVTDFHWAKTNLGIMRYVGENNSGAYSSSSDLIYVDQASGCQGLSDAAVAALFNQ